MKSWLAALLLAPFFFMTPPEAMSHGKTIDLGKAEDAAQAFGPGARLVPSKAKPEGSNISWFYAVGPEGEKLGLVGAAKEETEHGYLVQATALGLDGKIIAVIPLRVMEDEKKSVDALIKTDKWWMGGAGVKPEGAALTLIKSVRRTAETAGSILAGR